MNGVKPSYCFKRDMHDELALWAVLSIDFRGYVVLFCTICNSPMDQMNYCRTVISRKERFWPFDQKWWQKFPVEPIIWQGGHRWVRNRWGNCHHQTWWSKEQTTDEIAESPVGEVCILLEPHVRARRQTYVALWLSKRSFKPQGGGPYFKLRAWCKECPRRRTIEGGDEPW